MPSPVNHTLDNVLDPPCLVKAWPPFAGCGYSPRMDGFGYDDINDKHFQLSRFNTGKVVNELWCLWRWEYPLRPGHIVYKLKGPRVFGTTYDEMNSERIPLMICKYKTRGNMDVEPPKKTMSWRNWNKTGILPNSWTVGGEEDLMISCQ